jgi:membrane-associated phospholipid phosphatase
VSNTIGQRAAGSPAQTPLPRPSTLFGRFQLLFLLAVAITGLVGAVAAIAPDRLLPVDQPLAASIRQQGELEPVFRVLTRGGSQRLALLATLPIALVTWRRCRALAVSLPVGLLLAIAVDLGVKFAVDRERPLDPLIGSSFGSFPSGHVMTAVVFFGLLPPIAYALTRRRTWFWLMAALSLVAVPAVAVSRVYLGAHWPTDVLASLVLGAAILLVTESLVFARSAPHDDCVLHLAADPPLGAS